MSLRGHHNHFARASVTDMVVRGVLLDREDGKFFSDEGDEPLLPGQAYDKGASYYHEMPVLPVDCIRPYDAGSGIAENEGYVRGDPYDDHYDWDDGGYLCRSCSYRHFYNWEGERELEPLVCKEDAFSVAWLNDPLSRKAEQEELMWETGGWECPVFLTLVYGPKTAYGTW